jgi:hypothetical protein
VFVLGTELYHLNKNNNSNNHLIAATIFTLAIITMSSIGAPAAATRATEAAATPVSPSGIQVSPEPVYREDAPPGIVTPINQTHISATHIGNGTLTLPNSNQTINTISNGTAIASLATPSAIAKTTITTPNGETATITIYEIIQFSNPTEAPLGGGKGIKIIIFHTNSTGMLAPLDGVIAAGINDIQPNGESELTAWRWESGLPLSTNMTTTSTNATPTSETNVTAATIDGGGEEQQ